MGHLDDRPELVVEELGLCECQPDATQPGKGLASAGWTT
jgi:hypothetical protein